MGYYIPDLEQLTDVDGLIKRIVLDKEGKDIVDLPLDNFLGANTGLGNPSTVYTDMLTKNNLGPRGAKLGEELVEDCKSLIFMVRPQFCLLSRHCVQDRKMSELLDKTEESINRFVRMTLDPRLGAIGENGKLLSSKLIDNNNAFIPLVSNSFVSMTGWPDSTTDLHVSEPGRMKEETMMVDGVVDFYGKFELDVEFRKVQGDPLLKLFSTWLRYPSLTYLGKMFPYLDFIRADEYDYNTRFYKLLLSKDGRYVRKIAYTGAAIPISVPDGSEFNDTGFGPENGPTEGLGETHTIRFAAVGASYNDPLAILAFNKTVGYFSPEMEKVNKGEGGGMIKIPFSLRNELSRYPSLPRINPFTMELEHYVKESLIDIEEE
jgi:hypothetical protein